MPQVCRLREAAAISALLFALAVSAMPTVALGQQSLTGRWFAQGPLLDNGEHRDVLLEIKQSGSVLTGSFRTPGYASPVKGTATGNHFVLTRNDHPQRPFIAGDLVSGALHFNLGKDHPLVAKPATAGEDIPTVPYIEPPAIRPVPANGLAKTPPMGWNSWNLFESKVSDAIVRQMADAMVSSGMRDAGYVYINIDDTWEGTLGPGETLRSNHKFPDMKALADYVHSKGLKLGIYSSPGPRTCAGYPGSYGHVESDAKIFASWGIDYLKYDWCSAGGIYKNSQLQPVYQQMGHALESTHRPIVYSLCEYGLGNVGAWGQQVGANLWRTTGDIRDEWSSMIGNIEEQVPLAQYAGPGHWNDPDMLEIGNGHMSAEEYRTHMSLWALSAAPLLAGNDIRNMTPATRSILLNREVIAVDQDPLGRQAVPVKTGDLETWIKPLADGSVAVGVVNLGAAAATGTIRAADLHLPATVRSARNLWTHQAVAFKSGTYLSTIPSHGTLLLRVSARR